MGLTPSRCFSELLPTRKIDIEALFANDLSHVLKVDFMRLKGSEGEDLLPERRQSINLKSKFLARVFVRHDQSAVV